MENLDKFSVIKGATVYNSTPGVTRDRAVKLLRDKYDFLTEAQKKDKIDRKLSPASNSIAIDFDLGKYDADTINAMIAELGTVYLKLSGKSGTELYGVEMKAKTGYYEEVKTGLFVASYSSYPYIDGYNIEILAQYDKQSDEGITLYSSVGWLDNDKDKETDKNIYQQGKTWFWSFVNFVRYAVKAIRDEIAAVKKDTGKIRDLQGDVRSIEEKTVGVSGGYAETTGYHSERRFSNAWAGDYYTELIPEGFYTLIKGLEFPALSVFFDSDISRKTYSAALAIDSNHQTGWTLDKTHSGIIFDTATAGDVVTANGGYSSFADLFKSYAPDATTTEKGAVKMAGKVDALADSATLAQAVERLNTLIAQLKSAGIMSEN